MTAEIREIIYSSIIGDALGYTLGGMKKAHIQAVFRDSEGYLDPAPALKNNMDKWKKPGLYSSITQFMLIIAASIENRNFRADIFFDALKKAPELPGTEFSFFREPGQAERHLITLIRSEKPESDIPFNRKCARLIPISTPLILTGDEETLLDDTFKLVSLFTSDTKTAVYTYLFLQLLLDSTHSGEEENIMTAASVSAEKSMHIISDNQHKIFNAGHNPDYFYEEARRFSELLKKLINVKNVEKGENIICESVNHGLKTPIARACVNIPESILPYAILLAEAAVRPESIFQLASREGGEASALASVSAALTAAFYGSNIPDNIKEGLANKKKILMMIDLLSSGNRRRDIIRLLYDSEPGLTLKEMEEFRARNKKEPKKNTPIKSRKDVESELTKHVVESWTKIDKAKWRKERNRE